MEGSFGPLIAVFCVVFLMGAGVCLVVGDFRHFSAVEKECREHGRIQNNMVRILCSVEEKK